MRLVKITGGLGNQMFIYAMYIGMKKRVGGHVHIDLSDMMHYHAHNGYELRRVFGVPADEFCINRTLKKVIEFLFFKTILERHQHGSMRPYTRRYAYPLVYFKGFYQNEKYFLDVEDEVRSTFTFDLSLANERSRDLEKRIATDDKAVSLHVRRGDYLQPKFYEKYGTVCGLTYYQNAIVEMGRHIDGTHYYVFSDDVEWVKENLPIDGATYVNWNAGADSWQDMMLMSRCRHHIICNSTFSWWGAWLNPSPGKVVIAPDKWFADTGSDFILPETWVKVPTAQPVVYD